MLWHHGCVPNGDGIATGKDKSSVIAVGDICI